MTPVPVLVYHSVSFDPPSWLRPYTVTPPSFAEHLDLIMDHGFTPLTISDLVEGFTGVRPLPPRPMAITFDDGYADFADAALPAMRARGIRSTLYVTTGSLRDKPVQSSPLLPAAHMLSWRQLADLEEAGVELGAHTHSHPQLDAIPARSAAEEVCQSKAVLEEELGHQVLSFAYPHGYWSRRVRQIVVDAGFRSACAVGNSLSSTDDDPMTLARLMLHSSTPTTALCAWLRGTGAPVAPFPQRPRTRAWRYWRQGRAAMSRHQSQGRVALSALRWR